MKKLLVFAIASMAVIAQGAETNTKSGWLKQATEYNIGSNFITLTDGAVGTVNVSISYPRELRCIEISSNSSHPSSLEEIKSQLAVKTVINSLKGVMIEQDKVVVILEYIHGTYMDSITLSTKSGESFKELANRTLSHGLNSSVDLLARLTDCRN